MQKKNAQEELRISLKSVDFNVWQWSENQLLEGFEEMFHELGLLQELQIQESTLKRFLESVRSSYPNNPFHNFQHCFCVTQMMYVFINTCKLQDHFSKLDLAILLTSCICHDLDHPGLSNSYQVTAKTDLASKYPTSTLENHHRDETFRILSHPESNIFSKFSKNEQDEIKRDISNLILATDMAKHNDFLADFESKTASFNFDDPSHKKSLKCILIKCCDISNECRPITVSEPWVQRLLEEYFNQSDLEKASGLPFAPFMDRDTVTKASSQIGFLSFVLIPLFESLSKVLPEIALAPLTNLRQALAYYKSLDNKR